MNLVWRGFKWQFRYVRTLRGYVLQRVVVRNMNAPTFHLHLPGLTSITTLEDRYGRPPYELVNSWWRATYDHMRRLVKEYDIPAAPFDTIPWEIHAIDDPTTRKIAKRNFKRARRL